MLKVSSSNHALPRSSKHKKRDCLMRQVVIYHKVATHQQDSTIVVSNSVKEDENHFCLYMTDENTS
eukprot:m.11021 g.11021  ORF g.11021 m.11021 type:complete len:66 (+) comp6336_c0_seq1:127-324(+)